MQLKLYFDEQKTGRCCLMKINVCSCHVEFSSAFLKLTNIYIATESLVIIHYLETLNIGNNKTWEKTTETAFRKCSVNRCSEKRSKIHRTVSVPESLFNIVSGLLPAISLRKRILHRCFSVITLRTSSLVTPDLLIKTSGRKLF